MPLNFAPRPGSAVDEGSQIVITAPRLLPASPPEDPGHNEYQYMFHVAGEQAGGLGLFGSDEMVESAGGRERVFTLDLSRDWVLESVLAFKKFLGNTDDDFSFLRGLAQGLVMANMDDGSSKYNVRYLAVTTDEALAGCGIACSEAVLRSAEGDIVLAEALVPVRTG